MKKPKRKPRPDDRIDKLEQRIAELELLVASLKPSPAWPMYIPPLPTPPAIPITQPWGWGYIDPFSPVQPTSTGRFQ